LNQRKVLFDFTVPLFCLWISLRDDPRNGNFSFNYTRICNSQQARQRRLGWLAGWAGSRTWPRTRGSLLLVK
jgi:hypothetical protein